MKEKRILVVEDDTAANAMVCAAVGAEGATPLMAENLARAAELVDKESPDLVILDLNLPDGDGLRLCRRLRSRRETRAVPIIALTAHGDMARKREGFAAGVDQFLTKPIELAELALWCKALLRRVELDRRAAMPSFTKGDLQIDEEAHLVVFRGKPIPTLTRREFQLLHHLARNSPRVFGRDEILSVIWRTVAVENLVDAHIYNLRRKLPPALASRLRSVPGKGFRYLPE